MKLSIKVRDERSDGPRHQPRERFENGHGFSERASHGGEFEANESSANDNDILSILQPIFHNRAFIERTHVKDTIEFRTLERQCSIAGANGKHEALVEKMFAGIEFHLFCGPINGDDFFAGEQINLVVLIELLWTQFDAFEVLLAQREAFRKPRPLVGDVRFLADKGYLF